MKVPQSRPHMGKGHFCLWLLSSFELEISLETGRDDPRLPEEGDRFHKRESLRLVVCHEPGADKLGLHSAYLQGALANRNRIQGTGRGAHKVEVKGDQGQVLFLHLRAAAPAALGGPV